MNGTYFWQHWKFDSWFLSHLRKYIQKHVVRVKNQDQEDEEGGRQNGSCLMCCAMAWVVIYMTILISIIPSWITLIARPFNDWWRDRENGGALWLSGDRVKWSKVSERSLLAEESETAKSRWWTTNDDDATRWRGGWGEKMVIKVRRGEGRKGQTGCDRGQTEL